MQYFHVHHEPLSLSAPPNSILCANVHDTGQDSRWNWGCKTREASENIKTYSSLFDR